MAQRWLQWLSGGILGFSWMMVIQHYRSLPPLIPIHFNAAGAPDNWGPKATIWILPVLASALFALFSVLHRYADRFPRKAENQNAAKNLVLLRQLFLQLRLAIVLVMAVGIYYNIRVAITGVQKEPGALVPFIMLVMLAPVGLFLFRVLNTGKRMQHPAN
jgi:uncharacterized membrane protein